MPIRRRAILSTLVAAGLAVGGEAAALCNQPRPLSDPPRRPMLQRPAPPLCLRSYGNRTAACEDWQLSFHRQAARQYLQALQDFAARSRDHARDAEAYAREIEAYARCEALELALP